MSKPKISIVVPVTRSEKFVHRLVKSIQGQTLSPEDYEILLMKGLGANAARSKGAEQAKGDLVFFLDDDCVLQYSELLNKWLKYFADHPQVDIAGGSYDLQTPFVLDTAYNLICRQWQLGADRRKPHLLGGHLLMRKKVLESVSFDREMNYGGTESEFCHRAYQRGFQLRWVPEFAVFHSAEMNWRQFLRKAYLQGQAKTNHRYALSLRQQAMAALALSFSSRAGYLPFFLLFFFGSKWGVLSSRAPLNKWIRKELNP